MGVTVQTVMILMMFAAILTMPIAVFAMEDRGDVALVRMDGEQPDQQQSRYDLEQVCSRQNVTSKAPHRVAIRVLETELESLYDQCEEAEDDGDMTLVAELEEEIAAKENDLKAVRILWEAEKLSWKGDKEVLEAEKDLLEALKEAAESELQGLHEKLTVAEATGADTSVLQQQMALKEAERNAYKLQIRDKIQAMKELIQGLYTLEEIETLDAMEEEMGEQEGINVLPFNHEFDKNGSVNLNTPPVIKDGRMLNPLRALSEAAQAEVSWDERSKEITIARDGSVIVLSLGSTTMTVNGETRPLDVPAELMNGRTVVPIRFIVDNLNLDIEWDADSQTVEVDAAAEATSEQDMAQAV